jgi:hypothetical protein
MGLYSSNNLSLGIINVKEIKNLLAISHDRKLYRIMKIGHVE